MRKWVLSRPYKNLGLGKAGSDVPLDSPDLKVYGSRPSAVAAEKRLAGKGEQYWATTLDLAKGYAKRCDEVDDLPF